jgi:hypothetical protein
VTEVSNKTIAIVAWCNMKIADCDREVAMAKLVGMEKLAEPFARDARFFRAILDALGYGSATTVRD